MGTCPWSPQDLSGMTGRFDHPMHGALETYPWRGLQWKALQRGGFNTDRAGRGLVSIAAQFFRADHRQRDGSTPTAGRAALGHAVAIPGHASGLMALDARHLVDGLMGLPQMGWGVCGQVLNAAQFTPHAHRGAADLLKLPDAPCTGPGLHPLGGFHGGLSMEVIAHLMAVDVLGNVLGDIACGRALVPVDGLEVAAMLGGTSLIGAVFEGVVADGVPQGLHVLRGTEQKQVPMGCAVMLGLGYAKAIHGHALAHQ